MSINAETADSITASIVEALESGVAPWERPWLRKGPVCNLHSNKPYRGINVLLLWVATMRGNFADNRWLTFKQALDLGGNVRKGEKGTKVIFWKILEKDNKKTGEKDKIPMARAYTVFNYSQCENLPEKYAPKEHPGFSNDEKNPDIETFIANTGANIMYGNDRAGYLKNTNDIIAPAANQFVSMSAFYATIFHELGHWTGSENRLKRQFGERFGTEAYAFEELVAELTSAFLCAEFGVTGKLQHREYIATWINVIKNDKNAIFTAAKLAQEACDYLLHRSFANKEENETDESGT